jgi:hypothetical protein
LVDLQGCKGVAGGWLIDLQGCKGFTRGWVIVLQGCKGISEGPLSPKKRDAHQKGAFPLQPTRGTPAATYTAIRLVQIRYHEASVKRAKYPPTVSSSLAAKRLPCAAAIFWYSIPLTIG